MLKLFSNLKLCLIGEWSIVTLKNVLIFERVLLKSVHLSFLQILFSEGCLIKKIENTFRVSLEFMETLGSLGEARNCAISRFFQLLLMFL